MQARSTDRYQHMMTVMSDLLAVKDINVGITSNNNAGLHDELCHLAQQHAFEEANQRIHQAT